MSTIFTAREAPRRRRPPIGPPIVALLTVAVLLTAFMAYRTADRDSADRDAGEPAPGVQEESTDAPATAGNDDGGAAVTPDDDEPGVDGPAPDPSATPPPDRPEPPPPTPPVPVTIEPDAPVEDVLETWLAVSDQSLTDPSNLDETGLERLATGSALEQLRSTAAEYDIAGLRQQGRHEIVSLETAADGPDEVSVDACLDRRDVRLLHSDGSPVLVRDLDDRALRTFVLRRSPTGWQVAELRFPEPDAC